jgi:hypothetical protein
MFVVAHAVNIMLTIPATPHNRVCPYRALPLPLISMLRWIATETAFRSTVLLPRNP